MCEEKGKARVTLTGGTMCECDFTSLFSGNGC